MNHSVDLYESHRNQIRNYIIKYPKPLKFITSCGQIVLWLMLIGLLWEFYKGSKQRRKKIFWNSWTIFKIIMITFASLIGAYSLLYLVPTSILFFYNQPEYFEFM